MKNKILNILIENKGDFISGEKISDDLGLTRAAVWKHIKTLKEEGYIIESITGKGYQIISSPDILKYEEIEEYLETDFMGRQIKHFQSIDSTNKIAKEIACDLEEGTAIIAEEQILGKGRMGRDWISPKNKGIWMSIVLKPEIDLAKVSRITQIGAAAIYMALEEMGISAKIKWPNDILINNKKVAGILTEMTGELNRVDYIIMGIGLNVNLDINHIPEDLRHKATSLKIENGKKLDRKKITANILNELEKYYIDFKRSGDLKGVIDILKDNSILIGREVRVIEGSRERIGLALDIDLDGSLIVDFKEGRESIYSGEVSIRGIHGYI